VLLVIVLSLELDDFSGARALVARLDAELDTVAFVQIAIALGLDGRVMDENVLLAVLWRDEAEALLAVEKLDSTCDTVAHELLL
jgi:hypothetical protein